MSLKLKLQSDYYLTLADHQKETDALWHDMKKHIDLVKSLVNSEQPNISDEYLEELESDLGKRIKVVRTKQPVISALLTEQLKRAEKDGIFLDLDVKLEEETKVSPVDLCIILGNLFDNAFNACSLLPLDVEKYIKVELKQRENSLMIRMENIRNPDLKAIKRSGKHGFGLKNVKKAVGKYNGIVNIDLAKTDFIVDIVIP